MEKIDFKKCEICTEKRCILSFLQKDPKQIEKENQEAKLLKNLKELKKKKLTNYWIKEKEYWNKFKKREMKLINYDRKPYMDESDWRHDSNWFIGIQKLMELDEQYYNSLFELFQATIQDLI